MRCICENKYCERKKRAYVLVHSKICHVVVYISLSVVYVDNNDEFFSVATFEVYLSSPSGPRCSARVINEIKMI